MIYRQEISLEAQAIYLQALADLPLDRLELAFEKVIREWRPGFGILIPPISEIRAAEASIQVPKERIEAAYQRRKLAIEAAPAPKLLKSALDDEPPAERRAVRQMSEAEKTERLRFLNAQLERIKVQE